MAISVQLDDTTCIQDTIVQALWQRVVDDAAGTSEPALTRYHGSEPDARFWLGMLIPEAAINLHGASNGALERFSPAAQGFSFRVRSLPCTVELSISFAL